MYAYYHHISYIHQRLVLWFDLLTEQDCANIIYRFRLDFPHCFIKPKMPSQPKTQCIPTVFEGASAGGHHRQHSEHQLYSNHRQKKVQKQLTTIYILFYSRTLTFLSFLGVATGHFFGEPLKNTDISDEILVTSWLIPNNHQSTFIFQPYHVYLAGGIPTPLKNHGVKVSWDDFPFPTEWNVCFWKVIKFMFQTTNQSCLSTCLMVQSHISPISYPFNQV